MRDEANAVQLPQGKRPALVLLEASFNSEYSCLQQRESKLALRLKGLRLFLMIVMIRMLLFFQARKRFVMDWTMIVMVLSMTKL